MCALFESLEAFAAAFPSFVPREMDLWDSMRHMSVAGEGGEHWCFVQLADSQLGMFNSDDDPDDWAQEVAMLNLAVDKINALKPRPQFAIVCGDLVHPFPEGPKGQPERQARAYAEYQRITARIDPGIALVCVCGNHDVGNVPSRASVTKFEKRFGPSYGEFRCGRTRCVVLNSQLLNAKEDFWSEEPHVEAARDMALEQDAWLGTRFPCRTLFFSHVPPFVEAPDEPKGYFNHEPKVREAILDLVTKIDPKTKWFCGHFHRNAGGWRGDAEVVVTSAVGCALGWNDDATREERLSIPGMDWAKRRCDAAHSGLRVVCYAPDDAVFHKFFALEDVPETIDFAEARRTWAGLAPTPTSWASPDRPPTPPTPPASWSRECVLPPHPRT